MRALFLYVIDIIFPPRRTDTMVRTLTVEQLHGIGGEDGLPYHDPRVQALVWELKYYGTAAACGLAGAYLSEMLLATAAEEIGAPLLIPVPMHTKRRRERGHNQTELLCLAALGHMQNTFAYAPKALERVVDTKHQQGLPRHIRMHNVKNSMVADPELVEGRVCIVVDDVTTTGATLQEAKRALRQSGARAVHTIALARSW